VSVTDNGTPTLKAEETFTVTVAEVNAAPAVAPVADQVVALGGSVAFTATATDSDAPAQTLTFSLVNGPAGAAIDPASGAFTWTPAADQGGVTQVVVRVTDSGDPGRSTDLPVTVTVQTPPQITPIAAIVASTGNAVSVPLAFTDLDNPTQTPKFTLVEGPADASVAGGVFTWVPSRAGTFQFRVRATDADNASLFSEQTITVHVNRTLAGGLVSNGFTASGSPLLTVSDRAAEVSPMMLTQVRQRRRKGKRGRTSVVVTVRNVGDAAVQGPLNLVLSGLESPRLRRQRVRLQNASGFTANRPPAGVPYVVVGVPGDRVLDINEEVAVTLNFRNPQGRRINFTPRVFAGPANLL
jgi:hypothetical protein